MESKIVRSYSLRVAASPVVETLARTHKVYNDGASFFLGFWTKLLGGMEPSDLTWVDDEEKPLFLLPLWFSLEAPVSGKKITTSDVATRFRRYWLKTDGNPKHLEVPAVQHFLATLNHPSKREDAFWVDRREEFKTLGVTRKDINYLATDPRFVLRHEDSTVVRQFVSSWWGNGKKTTWQQSLDIVSGFAKRLKRIRADQGCRTAAHALFGELGHGITTEKEARARLQAAMGKQGRPDAFVCRCAALYEKPGNISDDDLDSIASAIESVITTCERGIGFEVKPWMEKLRDDFLKTVGIPFFQEEVSQMFVLAVARHRSWHSWMQLQLKKRVELFDDLEKLRKAEVELALASVMTKHREGSYLHLRQFRGIQRFLAACESGVSLTDVVRSNKDDIGDLAMFMDLASVIEKRKLPYETVKESIEAMITAEVAAERYYTLKSPSLCPISAKSPVHPWFGTSKPPLKIELADDPLKVYKKDQPQPVMWVSIRLFDGKEFRMVDVPLRGKRFRNEIYATSDKHSQSVPRDTNLVRSVIGNENVNMEDMDLSLQIRPEQGRWYATIAASLSPWKRPKIKDVCQNYLKGGVPFLSVDLGQRNAAAFCLYESSHDGEITVVSEKKKTDKVRLHVVEMGFLAEDHRVDKGSICRLRGVDRKATKDDEQVWTRLYESSGWKGKKTVPHMIVSLNSDVSLFAKRIGRHAPLTEALDLLTLSVDQIMGRRASDGVREYRGGLSFQRIQCIRNLISAWQSAKSRLEFNGETVPQRVVDTLEFLRKKLNNVRRERVRVTANLIIRKTLESKAPVLAIENLNIRTSQDSTKKRNQRTSDWCCRKIIQNVKSLASEFGIIVKEIKPEGSSMEDFTSGEFKPRFREMRVADLTSDYGKKHLASLMRRPVGHRESIAHTLCRQKVRKYGLPETATGLRMALEREAVNGRVYVPYLGGPYYYTEMFGWIDSDLSAAAAIGIRGMKLLMGWFRERQGDETTDEQGNRAKSVASNALRRDVRKKIALDISRVASTMGERSWTVGGEGKSKVKIVTWTPSR